MMEPASISMAAAVEATWAFAIGALGRRRSYVHRQLASRTVGASHQYLAFHSFEGKTYAGFASRKFLKNNFARATPSLNKEEKSSAAL
jgi:hypothetical protein